MGFKGKTHSQKTKNKLSLTKLGTKNPMYGKSGDRHPRYGKHPYEVSKIKMSIAQKKRFTREKPPNYGKIKENASSSAIHYWVKSRLPKTELCQKCNNVKPRDLANISHGYNPETYTRDLKNWSWLCRRCHMEYDGIFEMLRLNMMRRIVSEETKKRMSEKHKGIKMSDETKEKMRRNHNPKSNLNLIPMKTHMQG